MGLVRSSVGAGARWPQRLPKVRCMQHPPCALGAKPCPGGQKSCPFRGEYVEAPLSFPFADPHAGHKFRLVTSYPVQRDVGSGVAGSSLRRTGLGRGWPGLALMTRGNGERAKGDATACQSKMFDPPAPSDHLPCDAPTLRVVPVYCVLRAGAAQCSRGLGGNPSRTAQAAAGFAWERGLGA